MDVLHIANGTIVDQHNRPVFLRGVNIGGWMNLEHFINGHPGSESSLRRVMTQTLGEGKATFFFERLLDHFFNEDDVRFLKQRGVTAIRLPLNYRHFESDNAPYEYLQSGFDRLERALDWCERHGIYVILDLHAAQGWQNGDWHCDNSTRHALFWFQKESQDRFVALWQEFARRYAHRAVVAGYILLNEPSGNAPFGRFLPDEDYQPDWQTFNRVYRRAIEAVRAIDADTIIILEGDDYARRFEGLELPEVANLMVCNHNYIEPATSAIETYPIELGSVRWDAAYVRKQFEQTSGWQYSRAHELPLLVGEFGVNMVYPSAGMHHQIEVFADQMDAYNALGCHWTVWTYKDLGSMGWLQTDPHSDYMRVIEPVLRAKQTLRPDFGWLAGFPPEIQAHIDGLSAALSAHIPDLHPAMIRRYFAQAAMSTFSADALQFTYARSFTKMSEREIDTVLQSFRLENCVLRRELCAAIEARLLN